jgi:hypothetical protein
VIENFDVLERTFEKLYQDVQACGYEDVQVMWTMIHDADIAADRKLNANTINHIRRRSSNA